MTAGLQILGCTVLLLLAFIHQESTEVFAGLIFCAFMSGVLSIISHCVGMKAVNAVRAADAALTQS